MKEIWKDINNYKGFYKISNIGNVKSLNRFRKAGNGGYIQKGKLLKIETCYDGYSRFTLCKQGKTKRIQAHRLVGQAFIENTENKPFINHKNGIKNDNKLENLEWVTASENILHSYNTLGYINSKRKAINQYTLKMSFIRKFDSITAAAKSLGISNSNLSMCCRGKYKTIKGYIWQYAN